MWKFKRNPTYECKLYKNWFVSILLILLKNVEFVEKYILEKSALYKLLYININKKGKYCTFLFVASELLKNYNALRILLLKIWRRQISRGRRLDTSFSNPDIHFHLPWNHVHIQYMYIQYTYNKHLHHMLIKNIIYLQCMFIYLYRKFTYPAYIIYILYI